MSLSFQQLLPAHLVYLDKGGETTYNLAMNQTAKIQAGKTYNIRCRFDLPRTTATGKGTRLNAVSLVYRTVSGTLTSMTPSLTKYVYTDGSIEGTTGISITTPDADFATENYVLTTTSTVTRARSAVDSPVFENSVNTESISWLFNVALVASTDGDIIIHGFEVTYDIDNSGSVIEDLNSGNPYTADYTADVAKSGTTALIDSSGGSVTVSLPSLGTSNVGTTLSFKASVDSANAIEISPNASNSISGLNLNAANTVNKDYILAAPRAGDTITLIAGTATNWQVLSAAGTWTREA